MVSVGGLWRHPPYTGHNPLRILNKELLPHPLGPVIKRCMPGSNCKDTEKYCEIRDGGGERKATYGA